jgi:hypothetical protein
MSTPYNKLTTEQKEKYIQSCTNRRWKRKAELVAIKGNKCQICGYNKCLRALTFHHRDPTQKSFALDIRILASKSWETLISEIEKCDLLCANCHSEIEDAKHTKYNRRNKQ